MMLGVRVAVVQTMRELAESIVRGGGEGEKKHQEFEPSKGVGSSVIRKALPGLGQKVINVERPRRGG